MSVGLSVCCQVGDPPRRAAAMLQPLREIADEVVLGVDDRLDRTALAPLRAMADVLVPLTHAIASDRLRPQLFAKCTQPWILMVDSDEVASHALLQSLPRLLGAEDVVQYRIARRWCYPDVAHWLDEVPWWPDFQTRLVRREVAAIAGVGPHDGLLAEEPARFLGEPLYHLDCVLGSFAARAAKAAQYEVMSPRRHPYGGGPFNDTFYLPERYATRPLAVTPAVDVERLRAVIAADPRPREAVLGDALRGCEPDEARASAGPLDADAYAVDLEVVERDTRFAPGERRPLAVAVHNRGTLTYPGGTGAQPEIRAAYRLRDTQGNVVVNEGLRTHFPAPVWPGSHELVPVLVQAPAEPGRYMLEIDLVHEGVGWFNQPVTVEILVADRWARFAGTR